MDRTQQGEIARALVVAFIQRYGTAGVARGLALAKEIGVTNEDAVEFLKAVLPEAIEGMKEHVIVSQSI